LRQRPEYLRFLREICCEHGALLVFDEVITGFRLGMDGAAGRYGVTPDLVTFGKVIGGGMPVGAFGGRKEIMEKLAPLGDVYQAGTLSGNPVAMSAGVAALRVLEQEKVHERLEGYGRILDEVLGPAAARAGNCLVREGSIFWVAMQAAAPRRVEDIDAEGMKRYAKVHEAALERKLYLAPSGWEVGFLNIGMTEEEVRALADVLAALP
jgi:glutamate-1-semialdehyde 2,1-aminomutase